MPTLREMSDLADISPSAFALTVVRMLRTLAQREPATFEGVAVGLDAVEQKYGSMDDPAALAAWLDDLGPVLDIGIPEEVWDECDEADVSERAREALDRLADRCSAPTEAESHERLLAVLRNAKSDPDVRALLEMKIKEVCSLHGVPAPPVEALPDLVLAPARSSGVASPSGPRKRSRRREERAAVECALAATADPPPAESGSAPDELTTCIQEAVRSGPLTAEEVCDLDLMAERIERGMREAQRRGIVVQVDRQAIKRRLRRSMEAKGFYVGADYRVHYRQWSWQRWVRLGLAAITGSWAGVTAWLLFWR